MAAVTLDGHSYEDRKEAHMPLRSRELIQLAMANAEYLDGIAESQLDGR
jgi:hypothetical protein